MDVIEQLPVQGRIKHYSSMDGIGTIMLESGKSIKFGADSLRGIEPDFGGPVTIHAIREHGALGECAFDVRDAAIGLMTRDEQRAQLLREIKTSNKEAEFIGNPWATVMFEQLPPMTYDDWTELEFGNEASIEVYKGGLRGTVNVFGSFVIFDVSVDLPDGGHAVTIYPNFLFSRELRASDPQGFPDPWSADFGITRVATVLVLALLDAGGVAVEPIYARCLKPAAIFRAQAGDPVLPEVRSWEAWIHGGRDTNDNFITTGMEAHVLPDVTVVPAEGIAFDEQVRVGLDTCRKMVESNRSLEVGESLNHPEAAGTWHVTDVNLAEVVLKHDTSRVEFQNADDREHDPSQTGLVSTKEEQYFLNELRLNPTDVLACGYFTSPTHHVSRSKTIAAALQAKSWFVGLTNDSLYFVETRAAATSKPLLENKDVRHHPLTSMASVFSNGNAIEIVFDTATYVFEPKLENFCFPSQGRLLEELLKYDPSGPTLEKLKSMRRVVKLKRWIPFALALGFVIIYLAVT